MDQSEIINQLNFINSTYHSIKDKIINLPGTAIVLRYIQSSYQNDPIRSVFELCLVLFAVRYFLASKYSYNKQQSNFIEISDAEVNDLIADWEPEPIVKRLAPIESVKLDSIPVIEGPIGSRVTVKLSDRKARILGKNDKLLTNVLNFSAVDQLDFSSHPEIRSIANKTIREYGVGACGPPGFYGYQEPHKEIEEKIAKFLGTESAIIYGQHFCTLPSVIPAFLKRGDIAIVDENCNLAIQQGLTLARCTVRWVKHNDLDDLVAALESFREVVADKPETRRFIITEGLFENSGDSPDLKSLVDLKYMYRYRILLDESLSIGLLGATGRGLCEEAGVPRSEIDLTIGSLAGVFAGCGGFCASQETVVTHQRIGANSYVFSASPPGYLVRAARRAMELIDEDAAEKPKGKSYYSVLKQNAELLVNTIRRNGLLRYVELVSRDGSPIVMLRVAREFRERLGLPERYSSVTHRRLEVGNSFTYDTEIPEELHDEYAEDHGLARRSGPESVTSVEYKYLLESNLVQKILNKMLYERGVLLMKGDRMLRHESVDVEGVLMKMLVNVAFSSAEVVDTADKLLQVCQEVLDPLL